MSNTNNLVFIFDHTKSLSNNFITNAPIYNTGEIPIPPEIKGMWLDLSDQLLNELQLINSKYLEDMSKLREKIVHERINNERKKTIKSIELVIISDKLIATIPNTTRLNNAVIKSLEPINAELQSSLPENSNARILWACHLEQLPPPLISVDSDLNSSHVVPSTRKSKRKRITNR